MARAHKIYFTWKNNNKKENQQEWQIQGKILKETNSLPLLLLQSILRWEIQIKTNQNTNKAMFVCISLHWTSPLTSQSQFWEELLHHLITDQK